MVSAEFERASRIPWFEEITLFEWPQRTCGMSAWWRETAYRAKLALTFLEHTSDTSSLLNANTINVDSDRTAAEMMTLPKLRCQFLCVLMAVIASQDARAVDSDIVDFSRDVRPILSDNCFRCHGPDEETREADLRMDQPEGLFAVRDGQPVVKPGDVDESSLLHRILSHDPNELMPPPDSNKSLTEVQKAIVIRWVQQGAMWEQHWSFERPVKPDVPTVDDDDWCRNEIDQFVLAKQVAVGLTPSVEASPHTLLRRLYLDLIGLPPTVEEANHWIAKIWGNETARTQAPEINEAAYQNLVDHLLKSPHYGERWARRWLDLARYADTNGYEKDRDRSMWPYRDWVVNAINADMPFDRFTIEQLAGDMLPNATIDQRVATGFHRNTMLNEEGGIDPLEFRYHAMTDRVATTGTTWLGLTLGCCQCHTHKYDPISHREYFQVMAFLNNADEPVLELPDPELDEQWSANRRKGEQKLAELPGQWPVEGNFAGAELEQFRKQSLNLAFEKWIKQERAHAVTWNHLRPQKATANLPLLTILNDDSIYASGDTAKRDDYLIELSPSDQVVTALRLEALPDERLPAGGPGSTYYEGTLGDFYLTEIVVESGRKPYKIASASDSFSKNRFGKNPANAALSIDGDVQTGWSVHGRQAERHVAVFVLEEAIPPGQAITIRMSFGRHFASSLGRFRFSATTATSRPDARTYSPDIAQLIRKPVSALQQRERDSLMETFLLSAPEFAGEADEIRKLNQKPSGNSTLVFAERPADHPRPTHRHHRGEYLQPKERVRAALPTILKGEHGEPTNRLEFARWLVSDQNPLTARVVVNRHWAAIFGTGIVKTIDDFGLQGESPSHPQLLDWLAVTFAQDDGWSLRALHRRIVTSSTYRQASVINIEASSIDPENRLLSYSPRYRLDAEIIRDQFLVAADVLSEKRGGVPVRPLQPKGVTEVAYGNPKWTASAGDDRYRRSLYTFAKRTAPFAMFSTFDAPSGEACIARRDRSNSPLQALTLLNDVMLIDFSRQAGRHLAKAAAEHQGVQETLNKLFRSVLVRHATAGELKMLQEFFDSRMLHFQSSPTAANDFMGLEATAPEQNDTTANANLAAWSATARAVFGLDEALNRE